MGLYYQPPGPYLGGKGQPYDPSKGLAPSILSNIPSTPGYVFSSRAAQYAKLFVNWLPADPAPWPGRDLPPSILNNPITQGGGWNQRDAVYQSVILATAWLPPPPAPTQKGPANPVLLAKVDIPPKYSIVSQAAAYNLAWQVTWGVPPLGPLVQPRGNPPPPAGKRHKLWHTGPTGVRMDDRDHPEVDANPPDE